MTSNLASHAKSAINNALTWLKADLNLVLDMMEVRGCRGKADTTGFAAAPAGLMKSSWEEGCMNNVILFVICHQHRRSGENECHSLSTLSSWSSQRVRFLSISTSMSTGTLHNRM